MRIAGFLLLEVQDTFIQNAIYDYNISCHKEFFKISHLEVRNPLTAILEHICLVKNSGTKHKGETQNSIADLVYINFIVG